MKKLIVAITLLLGLACVKTVHASDVMTSTWQAKFIAYVATNAPTGNVTVGKAGGLDASGTFDLMRVFLSSGYNNGAYFVCVDSLPLAQAGGAETFTITDFPSEQYLFPPFAFSASTITANLGLVVSPSVIDMRQYNGGGATIKNGLSCFVVGDTVNRYWWTLETEATQLGYRRRQ